METPIPDPTPPVGSLLDEAAAEAAVDRILERSREDEQVPVARFGSAI